MSPRRAFDRFMLDVEIGRNLKVARLTTPERWCMVAGVLAIAAKAPVRGALLIGDQRVEDVDVARQADVPRATAAATLRKLRELGMIHEDEEIGAEVVHDFNDWNPAPKVDRTAAERMRRMRAREARNEPPVTPPVTRNERNSDAPVTPPEVEGEVEVEGAAASPVGGGSSVSARSGAIVAAADSDQGQEEGTPGGLHPAFAEVMTILEATRSERPGVVVNDFAVNSALMAHRKVDAVSAAHTAAARIAEGTSNTDVATVPLRWALRDAANGEQPSGQRRGGAGRGETSDVVSGRGSSSALTRAMARDREQAELRRRRAEQEEASA